MKLIPLTKGFFAKVDDDDYERLSKFRWQVLRQNKYSKSWYARRGDRSTGKLITVFMHKDVFGDYSGRMDHIDGDGLNNQKSNLRMATPVQNGMNRRLQVHTSPFKGVSFQTKNAKYKASIRIDKKDKYLGLYDSPVDAAFAYDYVASLHYSEFEMTNKRMGLL